MGFDWCVHVGVVYALEVIPIRCYSRFAIRCLKMQPSQIKKSATNKRPAENDDNEDRDWPCSDTESDIDAMDNERLEVYNVLIKHVKNGQHGDYCDSFMNHCDGEELLTRSVRSAIDTFLPGKSNDFDIRVEVHGGAWGRVDKGASNELMYISYVPAETRANGGLDGVGRGSVNVPWGNKLTPIGLLAHDESVQVNAAMSLIADRLGLTPHGPPGYKLLSTASGG